MKLRILLLISLLGFISTIAQKSNVNATVNLNYEKLEKKIIELNSKNDSLNKKLNNILINDYKSTDVIDKVNNYYDNAWSKLIYLLSIIGAITVVILPYFLTLQQKRELKLNKLDFQEDVDRKIIELENKIINFNKIEIEKLRQEIENLNKNITEKQNEEIAKIYAMTYYLQGLNAKTTNNSDLIVKSFTSTINHLIKGKSSPNIKLSLDYIIDAIRDKIKKQSSLSKSNLSRLQDAISSINENYPDKFDEQLDILKDKLEKMNSKV
jgi:hypothetical protein